MSFDSFNNLRTINGFELLKYVQAKYKGIHHLKFGFCYRLSKKSLEGDPKLIKAMAKQIDLKVFSC
jgi:hypothetical protein